MTRRDLLELGMMAAGLAGSKGPDGAAPENDDVFWTGVRSMYPQRSGPVNFLNSGGGACPTAILELLARYQMIAASGGEDADPVLTELKESGSSLLIRELLAESFGCHAGEIALTRNAMEALGTALLGIDLAPGDEVLTTTADYDSCLQMIRQREMRDAVRLRLVDVPMPSARDEDVVAAFEAGCTPRTKLILMCHMYNKNGQILPVARICDMARQKGIVSIVDGAQTIGQIDFRLGDLGCDIFAASLHKWFHAPRGTGFLYVRKAMIDKVWPIWPSWSGKAADSIEKFEDYGTVSKAIGAVLPSLVGFNRQIGIARKEKRLRRLRDQWLGPLLATGRVRLLTDLDPAQSCAITAFHVDGIDPDRLSGQLLERHNILIGSIRLADKPDFKGNTIAADITNSGEEIERLRDALLSLVGRGAA